MEIKVNGESVQLEWLDAKVVDVLRSIGVAADQTGIAVALNMELVPRSAWAETAVQAGDALEVITARQGG